jgi:hypothetical protein
MFEFKGRDSRIVLQDFIKSLKETYHPLNKELDYSFKINSNPYIANKPELDKQTNCSVCKNEFIDSKDKHLHHEHKI